MKLYLNLPIVCAAMCIVFSACKKENQTVTGKIDFTLTSADANKTTTVVTDQTIALVLDNPGDGGYQFNEVQFNSAVLNLESHIHESRPNPNIGDAGYDTWTFKAQAAGSTQIRVMANRGSTETIELFKGEITVR